MLISDFMEQNKLLPYNLESNGRGLADQRGRSFRVVVTFGYFKSVGVIRSLVIVFFFLNIYAFSFPSFIVV